MAYEQWNGVDIVPMPAGPGLPGLREVHFTYVDTTADSVSPYTRVEQIQYQPGGDFWRAEVVLPQLADDAQHRYAAREWSAWLAALRGRRNVFRLGDPLRAKPAGRAQLAAGFASLQVDGPHLSRSTTLHVKGLAPSLAGQLLRGDHLQVGSYRLHEALVQGDADGDGKATLQVFPSLREPLAGGELITLRGPQGLFRLAGNERERTANETRLTTLGTIKCVEAR